MTPKKKAFVEERAKDPLASGAEIARRAGYSPNRAKETASDLLKSPEVANRLEQLGKKGLDYLEKQIETGKVEIANVQAAKILVETAYGKPKDNPSQKFGDVTINVNKVSDIPLLR
jgi:phage terminase small subunit